MCSLPVRQQKTADDAKTLVNAHIRPDILYCIVSHTIYYKGVRTTVTTIFAVFPIVVSLYT